MPALGGGQLTLIHGSARSLPLADQSIHLIVTSPPYWKARDYRDSGGSLAGQLGGEPSPHLFLANLWAVLDDCWRVLRDDGSCWVNLGDKLIDDRRVSGGLRMKCRALIPHRFALGLIDPEYRQWVEQRIMPRCAYCNGYEDAAYCTCGRSGLVAASRPPQWICRMDAVWSKANGLPESVTDRVRASHEYWFHLSKSERYYAAMDEIREEYSERVQEREVVYGGRPQPPPRTYAPGDRNDSDNATGILGLGNPHPRGKLPGSVWEVATEPLTLPPDLPQHFAAFPSWFPRRIIAGWSPSGVCTACGEGRRPVCEKRPDSRQPYRTEGVERRTPDGGMQSTRQKVLQEDGKGGDLWRWETHVTGYACACLAPTAPTTPARILDPFSGTGTTAIVAAALGRHGIGVDLSWDYHRIARWRDRDGGLRAKALGVDRPAREVDGQMSLLGEAG